MAFALAIVGELRDPGAPEGTVYYTLDGSDPRLPGGEIDTASAIEYAGEFELTQRASVLARALVDGEWSALAEATFAFGVPGTAANLAISEIQYNPPSPTDAELAREPGLNNDDFEFIELLNIGTQTIDLAGMQLAGAIRFTFPADRSTVLRPGEYAVLVEDRDAFALRYFPDPNGPIRILGQYTARLSNDGEEIVFLDTQGRIVLEVEYGTDGGWPPQAAGLGSSLELRHPFAANPEAYDNPDSWRASLEWGGSPGRPGKQPPPAAEWILY